MKLLNILRYITEDVRRQNKILEKEANEERVGVGINNARKLLKYLYPGKHLLRIQEENGNFSIHLTLMA